MARLSSILASTIKFNWSSDNLHDTENPYLKKCMRIHHKVWLPFTSFGHLHVWFMLATMHWPGIVFSKCLMSFQNVAKFYIVYDSEDKKLMMISTIFPKQKIYSSLIPWDNILSAEFTMEQTNWLKLLTSATLIQQLVWY